eukprot:1005309_1
MNQTKQQIHELQRDLKNTFMVLYRIKCKQENTFCLIVYLFIVFVAINNDWGSLRIICICWQNHRWMICYIPDLQGAASNPPKSEICFFYLCITFTFDFLAVLTSSVVV